MRIGYRHVGRILVIELDGGLGYDNFREFSKKVSDLMEKNGDLVVFDLGKCNYLSSWGVGALVSAAGKIRRNGKSNSSGNVAKPASRNGRVNGKGSTYTKGT